jgi:type IV secretion system protein VirB10
MEQENTITEATPSPQQKGIVSVNSRGGSSNDAVPKIVFGLVVVIIVVIGSLFGFNKWRANNKSAEVAAEKSAGAPENKAAAVGPKRNFDTDPPPLPKSGEPTSASTAATDGATTATTIPTCSDGQIGTVMIGQDNKPLLAPSGAPMRVCKDGKVVVPALAGSESGKPAPIGVNGAGGNSGGQQQSGNKPPSRFAGEVLVSASSNVGDTKTQQSPANDSLALVQAIMKAQGGGQVTPQTNFAVPPAAAGGNAPQPAAGSIGNMLTPSNTPMISASMLGNRNLILPKGRTIDCAMSMRLVNEVAGMTSCVLTQNVYSDNGRIVLLERGSEATGEYVAAMAQGQRRLFVLWSRIKTPSGVIINLNSPGADGLGTSGLDGYVDNHWWDRIGAAFLLSVVQDAIAYETTPKNGSGTQSVAVLQNTSQTGNRMAEKVLDSTINIKPTLYKNQGDRGSIYVARDLDFVSVYELQPK